jgi:hypothetical protein
MNHQQVSAGLEAQDEQFVSAQAHTAFLDTSHEFAIKALCIGAALLGPGGCPRNHHFDSQPASESVRKHWPMFAAAITIAILLPAVLPASIWAAEFIPFPGPPPVFSHAPHKKSLIEARTGYLWGINEIRFRDGDNSIIAPGKQDLNVNGLTFGLQGETFVSYDLAVRAQAWINIPQALRSDFMMDRTRRSWDTRAQFFEADLSVIYHLLAGSGMPFTAGLTAGYRFDNFDYKSTLVAAPGGTFHDHIHVHIPYLGIYYAHSHFRGSVVRLDILASPFTFSRVDGAQDLAGSITQVDGQSVTGFWFESLFGWSRPVGRSAFLGVFAKYNYLGLSGGAKLEKDNASTRFSMDSWHHLFVTALTATYTF